MSRRREAVADGQPADFSGLLHGLRIATDELARRPGQFLEIRARTNADGERPAGTLLTREPDQRIVGLRARSAFDVEEQASLDRSIDERVEPHAAAFPVQAINLFRQGERRRQGVRREDGKRVNHKAPARREIFLSIKFTERALFS
jgi:hypothetical protein